MAHLNGLCRLLTNHLAQSEADFIGLSSSINAFVITAMDVLLLKATQ